MAEPEKKIARSKAVLLIVGLSLPLALAAWTIYQTGNQQEAPPNADNTAPPGNEPKRVSVGGVMRTQPSPDVVTAFKKEADETKQFVAAINERNASGKRYNPPNKKLTKGMNANVDSMIEAIETGKHPERLTPMVKPKPFNKVAFFNDPQAYVDIVEPGRAWQSAEPGDGVKTIGTDREFYDVKFGESVRLKALAYPSGPVTFTSTDLGAFDNDLSSITVIANEKGWAAANFTITAGTSGGVNVSAASPLTSGRLAFYVNVVPAE